MKTETNCKRQDDGIDLEKIEVIPKLPSIWDRYLRDIPDGLVGSRIVRVGRAGDGKLVSGGGLVIDYAPKRSKKVRRVVLAFNDTGMWIKYPAS